MVEGTDESITDKKCEVDTKSEPKHDNFTLSNRTALEKTRINEVKKVQMDEKSILYEVDRNTIHTIPTSFDRIKDAPYQKSSVTASVMTQDKDDNELGSEVHVLQSHKALFANLDGSVEKSMMSHGEVFNDLPMSSLKDFTKICFTGVVIVFTSLNPSVARLNTIAVPDENLEISSTLSSELDHSIRSIKTVLERGDTTPHKNSTVPLNHSPFLQRHQQRLSALKLSYIDGGTSLEPYHLDDIKSNNEQIESSTPMIPVSEEEGGGSEEDSEDGFVFDDKSYEERRGVLVVDEDKPLHRPSLPVAVVQLLWKKIAEEYFYEQRESRKKIDFLLDFVQDILVNELAFLESICSDYDDQDSQQSQHLFEEQDLHSPIDDTEDGDKQNLDEQNNTPRLIEGDTGDEKDCQGSSPRLPSKKNRPSVRCLRINHDIHLLYARYIARTDRSLLSILKKEKIFKNIAISPRYSKMTTLDENEDWNPEVALNSMMSVACFACVDSCSQILENKGTISPKEQLQYEYSLEMLPWHLMRSTHYNAVVDVLTSASFVKARCSFLDLEDVANLHINDAEELLYNIATILQTRPSEVIDLDMNEILAESYRLLGGILHHEDAKTVSNQGRDEDDNFKPTSRYVLKMSQALQALGDSLLRHDQQNEAIKFYYRALMR